MTQKEYGPIQVQPLGLLGALNLKSAGKNPDLLLSGYQPVIEQLDWLLLSNAQVISALAGSIGNGDTGFLQLLAVPSGGGGEGRAEAWYIHQASVHVEVPIGDVIEFRLAFIHPANFTPALIGDVARQDGTATVATDPISINLRPFFVPPGAVLGIYTSHAELAASLDAEVYVRYTALPI